MPNPNDRLSPRPPPRRPKKNATLDRKIAIAGVAVAAVGAVAAIVVVPEARCFLHLGCDDPAKPPAPSISSTDNNGVINSGSMSVGGNLNISNVLGTPAFLECDKPYLQLLIDDRIGTAVFEDPNDSRRRFRVMIGNPTKDCTAAVNSVSIEVVSVIPDHHGAFEALSKTYKYQITLAPSDQGKTKLITQDPFSYPPNSVPDQLIIDVSTTKRGYMYGLRFVVVWMDLRTRVTNTSKTWVVAAPFPDEDGLADMGGHKTFDWRLEQLTRWRQQFDHSPSAVKDAASPGAPYKIEYKPLPPDAFTTNARQNN
jgi:hypothetical protein